VRFIWKLTTFFVTAFLTLPPGSACSLAFSPIAVGSSFTVKVSDYEGPVKGLLLKVTRLQDRDQSAATDGRGVAQFRNVRAGTWYLRAYNDNGFGEQLDVKANAPANVVVPFRWPSVDPIHVHSLAGTIRAPDAVAGRLEQSVLSLELLEAVSGRVLSAVSTSNRGEFDFGEHAQGLYFIRLKPYSFRNQQDVGGLITIAVHPTSSAVAEKLDLNLSWTSCGLMYTDQSQCRYPDLHVNKVAGHLSDSAGRPPFGGANISLWDATQNQVSQASTDASGNFSFPGLLAGTFQLRIEGGGFTPVHVPIHYEPTTGSSSLEIETAPFSCSTIRSK